MKVPLERVEVGTRLRGADQKQVAVLIASIAEVGLLSPITVYRRQIVHAGISEDGWGIVAGLHRLEACRSLGHDEIEVVEVDLPELKRQIAECDENLCGAKLTKAERAMFTVRRKQAYLALYPETAHGGGRSSGKHCHLPRFTADTAVKTGQAERTVRLDAARGSRIDPTVLSSLVGTELDTGRALDAIAAVPRQQQAAEVVRLQEGTRVRPTPAIKNAIESEEDWRRALFTIWNRGAHDWRERASEIMNAPIFDATRAGAA